ncbi:MAG: DUF445 family protein [Spirochaetales bacterium]|nr:DUF445 family protein [Spirochaetales bacterium]
MTGQLSVLFSWLAPPVLGAVIGFVTNDIAVRMLFRPFREKRIFGIRVPFTPGIIPKQRRKLASSIGRMVSDELLTEDAVRAQIGTPKVWEAIRENVAGITSSILDTRLDTLREQRLPLFQATLPEIVNGFLKSFLQSPLFLTALKSVLETFLDSVAGRPVRELIEELKLRPFLEEKLRSIVEDDRLKEKLKTSVAAWARRKAGGKESLSGILPEGLTGTLTGLFRSLYPFLLSSLRAWLAAPEVRHNLETRGKLLLDDILSKLNIFQRFFLSVGQYDRTLSDRMPGIVDDFINRVSGAIESEKDREEIVQAFARALDDWAAKGLGDIVGKDEKDLDGKISGLVDGLFSFLRREELGTKLADAAGAYLASREEESLESLAGSLLGLKTSQVAEYIVGRFTDERFAAGAAERVTAFAVDFFKTRGALTVGELLGADPVNKAEFDKRAAAALNGVLGQKLPEALKSLDLRGLVENKINGLDIEEVEGLLLMVIARQLKWINVFGAILGGLIGLLQVLLRALGVW